MSKHLLFIIYPFIMLITMIHVFYKLLEIYPNALFLLNIDLQNCSINIKRVYSDILSYNRWFRPHSLVWLHADRLHQNQNTDREKVCTTSSTYYIH
jgi:hypothetical protein